LDVVTVVDLRINGVAIVGSAIAIPVGTTGFSFLAGPFSVSGVDQGLTIRFEKVAGTGTHKAAATAEDAPSRARL